MPCAIAIVELVTTREVGHDLLAYYYRVRNYAGLAMLWVVDRDESKSDRTLLKTWILGDDEFDDLASAIRAWGAHKHRDDLQDRAAEALRRLTEGLKRPLWKEMSDKERASWKQTAAHLLNLLHGFGIETNLSGDDDGRSAA